MGSSRCPLRVSPSRLYPLPWPAPIDRTVSMFLVLHTPVTRAPNVLAICTANVPTPPAAPLMRTLCPDRICPLSRSPWRAVNPAMGTAAASSNVRLAGFGANLFSAAHTYSAKAPPRWPNTSSPARNWDTFLPTASTCPAMSTPATSLFGLRSPDDMRRRYGRPRMMCQSAALTEAARTRTSTLSASTTGLGTSLSCRSSGEPYVSWTIAFIREMSSKSEERSCATRDGLPDRDQRQQATDSEQDGEGDRPPLRHRCFVGNSKRLTEPGQQWSVSSRGRPRRGGSSTR